jgi:hypothetical protein
LGKEVKNNSMETFFVTTQTLENYGAHCESGKFADNHAHWKFKAGSDYIITGVDRLQDAVAFVASIAMENSIGYKEFPCHFEQVPHDYQTEYEIAQLDQDGEITYPAKRIDVGTFMLEREVEKKS